MCHSDGIQNPVLCGGLISDPYVGFPMWSAHMQLFRKPQTLTTVCLFSWLTMYNLYFILIKLIWVTCPPLNLDCDVEKSYVLTDLGLGPWLLAWFPLRSLLLYLAFFQGLARAVH